MTTRGKDKGITTPRGFQAAGGKCGIKPSGQPDLALIVSDDPCVAAGVFTRNRLPGAPVVVGKRHLRYAAKSGIRGIVCNSGNANAATGQEGIDNAKHCCRIMAAEIGCDYRQIIPSSTGVIGPQIPMEKIAPGIVRLTKDLARGPGANDTASRAIMTTDLAVKSAYRSLSIGGKRVHIGGIAKGSGMIAPNMATMLVFITTDIAIDSTSLKTELTHATRASFNRISVDQHTSPSDTVLVLANGHAGNRKNKESVKSFSSVLTEMCQDLAHQIVSDGEGAAKIFRVRVRGAKSEREADRVGKAIVDSPLVKTAVHGEDPNWGRIVTAAGYSGAPIDPDRMSLHIGPERDVCVFQKGVPLSLTKPMERKLQRLMKPREVVFVIDLGVGSANVEWLGCDLSREYIRINADYTT